jgi:glycosyltransferase involved in cell wall biosynthesis
MHAKVSVIIPTYNRSQTIIRAITSVLNQTYQNFEILIIDDGSTDDTERVIELIEDERIRYHKLSKNSGGGSARNKGIELSEGIYIAFLDSDDEWQQYMLEICVQRYISLINQDVILFSKLIMDNKITKKIFPDSIYQDGDLSEYIFCQHGLVSTITLFMPKKIARSVMFKENLIKHQDYDFVLRAYRIGFKFLMINKVLAIWHCEKRHDRMGVKVEYEDSFNWLKNNEMLFTPMAVKMFVKRDIILQVSREKKTIPALIFLLKLNKNGYINYSELIKNIVKLFFKYIR